MTPSGPIPAERANAPCWTGQGFEIWFFVVLVPATAEREAAALWVRLTRFADGERSDSRIWAVVSRGDRARAQRSLHALDELVVEGVDEPGALRIRVAARAELGHGVSKGECGSILWDLRFEPGEQPVARLPKLPGFVPLGTHSTHPYAEAPVRGFVELDGERIDLSGGRLGQMHIWGTQRVEWLRWAWVPQFEGGGALELTAVAAKAGKTELCSLWAELPPLSIAAPGLSQALRARVSASVPGVLHHAASGPEKRRVVVRVWAEPDGFAGWKYRQLGGGDLCVAQTNLAHCEVEVYRKHGLGLQPESLYRSRTAALEFHGPDDYERFAYVPWDASEASVERAAAPARRGRGPGEPPPGMAGRFVEMTRPRRIVALGLTYRAHAKETASTPDPLVFEKDVDAWTCGDVPLVSPTTEQLRAAALALDGGLHDALRHFGFFPAMLDYEVELGLVLREGLDDVEALAGPGQVALVVANDVSARSLQILGEGQAERLAYWGAAKSLPGFAPTGTHAFVLDRFDLERWPDLQLQTRVNAELRQDSPLSLLMETPRQMLTRVRATCGPLPPNTLLLTGTPAGVAFAVPAWKRALGDRLLDRIGKLRAALVGYATTNRFLRPGDEVEVEIGFLGSIVRRVGTRVLDRDTWIDSDFLAPWSRLVVTEGWRARPEVCPHCGVAASIHAYFDRDPRSGQGTMWAWCSACRRYEHGSLRPPAWWDNEPTLDRECLLSVPALDDHARRLDEHWDRLGARGQAPA